MPALLWKDSQVNFNWLSDDIIEGISSDYTSIEWTGFLNPLYTELYNFHVHSNDGIYLEIGDQILFNQLTSIVNEGDTLTLTSV